MESVSSKVIIELDRLQRSACYSTPSPGRKPMLPKMDPWPPKSLGHQPLQNADQVFSAAFECVHVLKPQSNGSDPTVGEATQVALVSVTSVTDESPDMEPVKISSLEQMQEETRVCPSEVGFTLEVYISPDNEAENRPIHLGRNTLSSEISPDSLQLRGWSASELIDPWLH